ncbi:hypothetical protein [Sulfurimonas paralvinellae]|uniref:Uncharacterized protein n=1 Tax=Sulfurimonas paralvinellae TaxID=317658 RepID=A0A7M1B8A7_9BACT|nr:hypothetical protein [Sulfurimonas paralvinellae]QOP45676.1 hypothetical protein FM071_05000 [Sulfurimonas paralvinellae]
MFLNLSSFDISIFNVLSLFSILCFVLCYILFKKHKQNYAYAREEEKYKLLRHNATLQYGLDIKDNIFSKIDLITAFMKEKFSSKSLLTVRVVNIANTSLSLYLENLKIKDRLTKAFSLSSDETKRELYKSEIQKNIEQNVAIEASLENLIEELMSKNNNDKKIDMLLNEFEHSTQIVSKIKKR